MRAAPINPRLIDWRYKYGRNLERYKGYEGLYQISNFGSVKSLNKNFGHSKRRGKIIKTHIDKYGYFIVFLCKDNKTKLKLVHKLLLETFKPDKSDFKSAPDEDRNTIKLEDLQVNHIDENKQNNSLNNLEYCTLKYNINYGSRTKKATESRKKFYLKKFNNKT